MGQLESVQHKIRHLQQQQQVPGAAKKPSKGPAATGATREGGGNEGEAGAGGNGLGSLQEELANLQQQAKEQYSSTQQQLLLKHLDQHVREVWEALPHNTLLLVATGQGDTAEVRRQHEMKAKRMARLEGLPTWSTADEAALSLLTEQEMQALCFCAIKP